MDIDARPFWAIKYGNDPKYSGFSQLTLQGYVGIGWTYALDLTKARTTSSIREVLQATMPDDRLPQLNHDLRILDDFINRVQEGDLVACYDQEDNHLFIGCFSGPCIYNTQRHTHFHLLRKVEWVDPLPISLYEGVKQMLTTSGTFWQVSNPQMLKTEYDKGLARKLRARHRSEQ